MGTVGVFAQETLVRNYALSQGQGQRTYISLFGDDNIDPEWENYVSYVEQSFKAAEADFKTLVADANTVTCGKG